MEPWYKIATPRKEVREGESGKNIYQENFSKSIFGPEMAGLIHKEIGEEPRDGFIL